MSNPPNVTSSNRLWSSEVAAAEAAEGIDPLKRDPAYVFGNGRKFVAETNPYESTDPNQPPAP